MSNYAKLQEVLKEIFEMDKADLDFGIYRIMNQKRQQVMDFIENRLPNDTKSILAETQSKDSVRLQAELDKLGRSLDDAGVLRETSPKYLTLKQQIAEAIDVNALEQEVFSHLASFFKRYYKDGDFISLRRYKKDVYAIPYEGEEVKLHWANHDQYYIKTSEYLKNYAFKLVDGKKVHFQLKEASTEQNNNKIQGDVERRFAIYDVLPIEVQSEELYINFTYEPHKKSVKQDDLVKQAIEVIQNNIPGEFTAAFDKAPTEKNKNRTLLEKHINNFISRNSFDFFIHKDLYGFLCRELDFYIKNEVLFVDDIATENPAFFTAQLSKIKALKAVAQKIITFLAQVEDFQKKLWLKKKFVISTNYCITLDRIPEKYYEEIVQNKAQLSEWEELYKVTVKSVQDLKDEPYLVLDTKHYSGDFKDQLLAEFDSLDEETDGLLINSENFQALNLIEAKFRKKVSGIYIDPPYNTNSSEIVYKNGYKHASWVSLIYDRVLLSKYLNSEDGLICLTIDDLELPYLWTLCNEIYGQVNHLGTATIRINPGGRKSVRKLAAQHEYALFFGLTENSSVSFFEKNIEDKTHKYVLDAEGVHYEERNLRKEGQDSLAKDGSERYYPIYRDKTTGQISSVIEFEQIIYPIDTDGNKRIWRRGKEVIDELYNAGDIFYKETKFGPQLYFKFKGGTNGEPPRSFWDDKKFSASEHGTQVLDEIIGKDNFSFPKSTYAVMDCLKVLSSMRNGWYLDFFAGSGTTGHAAIKLNRHDGGKRKYILVEMGSYFGTATKPRIQKVIYSDNWKNCKPQDRRGVSHMFKYQVFESYEDSLNNLELQQRDGSLFSAAAQEEYLLKYMLDIESKENLLNIAIFKNPFNYTLKVTENNELVPTQVDLVETFNYLIGLYVDRIQRVKDIKLVEGKNREGTKTLVIWRNLETTTNEETERVFRKLYDGVRSSEFDQIYINGDHHFDNVRIGEEQFKVKLIEDTFFKKMFNISEL